MPRFDGVDALRLAKELAPHVPFIFLSGTIGEERAIEAMRLGATDYVLKNNMRRLGMVVRRALSEVGERERIRIAEEERARLVQILEATSDYVCMTDPAGTITYLNAAGRKLTGLPNRDLLGDRTLQAVAHARRASRPAALLVLNLDRFKLVNESYSHGAGDTLLRMVADRLKSAVREGDTVARLGGDAFAVLATYLARPNNVVSVARMIREAMHSPFWLEGRDLHVTLSIGASVYPRDGEEFGILFRNADA